MTGCGLVIVRAQGARGLGHIWGCCVQLGGAIACARARMTRHCARDGVCPKVCRPVWVGMGVFTVVPPCILAGLRSDKHNGGLGGRWGQQDIMSARMRARLQHRHHRSGRKRQPTGPKPSATASRCAPCSLTHCPQACKQEACAGRAIRRQAPEHSPPPPLPPHLPAQEDRDALTWGC
jgi:hypothetical protein